ncbi:hypothetical protein ZEAMMB73_Zm00001d025829 [Zea mays]|uniref:Uncharacterized protein n=1 Tax=Zea mays TaxID=4577 RepID=A0A1D6JA05_MAIZE|nr:hypothetical protein ZEAMMB73_Zm00001d025829 [Zea mays]
MWRSQRDLNPRGRSPVQICDPPFSTLRSEFSHVMLDLSSVPDQSK